jgi:hypothetical protein
MESLSQPLSRRRALRLVAGSLLAVPAGLRLADPAAAAWTWCRTDPVIKVDGQVLDVFVSSDVAMKDASTGPTKIKIYVPTGSSVGVYATDQGFGDGYSITLATTSTLKKTATSTPIRVEVYVPSSNGGLPVKVDITPRSIGRVKSATAQGWANAWVVARTA